VRRVLLSLCLSVLVAFGVVAVPGASAADSPYLNVWVHLRLARSADECPRACRVSVLQRRRVGSLLRHALGTAVWADSRCVWAR
jgi:hypothetical protein